MKVFVTPHAVSRIAERISKSTNIKTLMRNVLRDSALVLKHNDEMVFQDFDGFFYFFATKDNGEFDLTLKTITIKPSTSLQYKMSRGMQLKYRDSPYRDDKIEIICGRSR